MSQNTSPWKPTRKQTAALEAAQEAGLNRSITAICEAAGVDRRGFYRWLENDADFRAAWDDIWRGTIKRHLPGVVAAVVSKAQDGDIPAARLLADMAGLTKHRIEADLNHGGTVTHDLSAAQRLFERHPELVTELFDDVTPPEGGGGR